ncbi:MAG: arginine decarboxylase [Catenulispora sp.]|nr:arginine decarboxylase [Catenulispora sp.]
MLGDDAADAQFENLLAELSRHGLDVHRAATAEQARALVRAEAGLGAALVEWDSADVEMDGPAGTGQVLRAIAERFSGMPVFLLVEGDGGDVPLWAYEVIHGCVWPLEDTAAFIAGRIAKAVADYRERVLPPFFKALRRFDDSNEFSFHTPGHAGGVAFLKSPAGRAYFDYFGERLFRSDLSISVADLGSPLEHTGPVGSAERNAARVFGAERTFFVLNGNSTANRIVGHHSAVAGERMLVDRNCHKSILHALTICGATPSYLVPQRNGLGLAGPIPPSALRGAPEAVSAVVTNSTYDGLCYDAVRVADLLADAVPRIHFDEAWFAHAAFHRLYAGRFGMAVVPGTIAEDRRPTVFATQSTHKLLAALSQAAMVHLREAPRDPVDPGLFNETYLMHSTTSPSYPIIAALDVAAAMMDGPGGEHLMTEAITEAVRFRQAMARLADRIATAGDRPDWFFGVWQPDTIVGARTETLVCDPSHWILEPGAPWHGFDDLEAGYCLLDPVKVTITCPGITAGGTATDLGIPARIVAAYLEARNIVVEKTGDYTLLVLFSLGTTKGKWGTLVDALVDFKHAYDNGGLVEDFIPALGLTGSLRELCERMHAKLRDVGLAALLDEVFTELPPAAQTPAECHARLVHSKVERVRLEALPNRIAASLVVVTPPGIPMLMPGEELGLADGPVLRYLSALQELDLAFPELGTDLHGVHRDGEGAFWVDCVTE